MIQRGDLLTQPDDLVLVGLLVRSEPCHRHSLVGATGHDP
jgi:hypothetical protein